MLPNRPNLRVPTGPILLLMRLHPLDLHPLSSSRGYDQDPSLMLRGNDPPLVLRRLCKLKAFANGRLATR